MASFAILLFFAVTGLIDASAVLMTLVSLFLIWFVKRRSSGLMLAGVCAVICSLIYLFLIP